MATGVSCAVDLARLVPVFSRHRISGQSQYLARKVVVTVVAEVEAEVVCGSMYFVI